MELSWKEYLVMICSLRTFLVCYRLPQSLSLALIERYAASDQLIQTTKLIEESLKKC